MIAIFPSLLRLVFVETVPVVRGIDQHHEEDLVTLYLLAIQRNDRILFPRNNDRAR